MATGGDITVTIRADTRPFDRALRRVRRKLWWWQYGSVVLTILAFIAGLLLGIIL